MFWNRRVSHKDPKLVMGCIPRLLRLGRGVGRGKITQGNIVEFFEDPQLKTGERGFSSKRSSSFSIESF